MLALWSTERKVLSYMARTGAGHMEQGTASPRSWPGVSGSRPTSQEVVAGSSWESGP